MACPCAARGTLRPRKGECPILVMIPLMDFPSKEDLAGPEPHSLNEKEVLKNFLGKSAIDIQAMLREHPSVSEDFMWMWPGGLKFYLPAILEYFQSSDSKGDWEFSHGMLCSLSFQAK